MTLILLHNPKCSKSREALALLQNKAIEFEVVEYLKDPLTAAAVTDLIHKLGDQVSSIIRVKDADALGLKIDYTPTSLVKVLVSYPQVMERPVLISNNRAVIGRPPEKILELL